MKDTQKAIAVSVDCNGRLCYLDPYAGSLIAVAEACRNVSCTGAEPVALTDGLNFGNPETNDVQYQLTESMRGIRDAALAFGVPVVSGNASLYNESRGRAIFPTPMIGALGLLDDVSKRAAAGFRQAGDAVIVIGASEPWDSVDGLAGSELAYVLHEWIGGRPSIDLALDVRVQQLCRDAIAMGLVKSAHDCSHGGIAVTIAESAIIGGLGRHSLGVTHRQVGRLPIRRIAVTHRGVGRKRQSRRIPRTGGMPGRVGLRRGNRRR